ncbi:oxygen-insensitive NAD(P)H nitroreductase [Yersinia canariae]|uniref:Oxygen-insensitive NAD(P)H nitroreductase n=1 Tax=Yersinia canariae TaxID=2607663 RepID=A0A857F155_9GAMM|nr:oxygen-insensitive NAD(P)H nitroreductase [Yersinia canariae]QHB33081.1 oxygen-insensitive NAD(P)H nitroreductase [Yersinia canariae]
MNIDKIIHTRYATKAYDSSRKLTAEQEQQIFDLLRFSPSSVNSQPWHFFALSSDEARQRIIPAMTEPNISKIMNSAMVIVFSTYKEITETHLNAVLAQEKIDGRFATEQNEKNQDEGRRFFVGLNNSSLDEQRAWMARQAYLSLGFLLLGAAGMGLDATPIEGFYRDKMDSALFLQDQNLTSVVIAAIGYHGSNDFNARLPKSRLNQNSVLTHL